MMSIIPLLPVAMSTDRSTDWPCALDMFNTTRSFTHISNTCVIKRLAFLNSGFIHLLSCTRSLPPSTTSHQSIVVCTRTSKSWNCSERRWGFPNFLPTQEAKYSFSGLIPTNKQTNKPNDCAAVRRLGNWGCSKKSKKNKLVSRSSDNQSESVTVQPKWLIRCSPSA